MVDWEQLKPDVADSLVVDLIDSLEQDLADEPKKEICQVIKNDQIFRQAWFPFFQCPGVQMLPFQKRVFLGSCVSVPRHFMAVSQMTLPKSPVNTRKRTRHEKDICSATYSHRRCKAWIRFIQRTCHYPLHPLLSYPITQTLIWNSCKYYNKYKNCKHIIEYIGISY